VATSYNNLGMVYQEKGDLDKAIELHSKALEIWRGLFGEKHPDAATSYNNLGMVYQAKADFDKAIELYTKALGIVKTLFGENHPHVARSCNNLGGAYLEKGDLARAIDFHTKTLEILTGLGNRVEELKRSLYVADLLERAGRRREAAKRLCQGVDVLGFLWSGLSEGSRYSLVVQVARQGEALKEELESAEFFNCCDKIKSYQQKLGLFTEYPS